MLSRPAADLAPLPWHPLGTRAIVSGLIAASAALVLWLWFAAPGLADDGCQLVQEFCRPDGLRIWNHVLYFPAAQLVGLLGARPDRTLWLLSALAGAVLVGTSYASAFVLTGDRRAAASTALVIALTPAVAYHATYVEVHALHAATTGTVVLALLLLRRWPRRVLQATFVGAALAALTHRSAALLVPALAAVAAASLQQSGTRRAGLWALFAATAGVACGYVADDLMHRWLGGPVLFESVAQVRGAQGLPLSTMLVDELLWPLCLLCTAAAAALTCRARQGLGLRFAPLLALVSYAIPIAVAGIATHGGYWLGAVPVLALGVAIQVPAVLASGTLARLTAAVVLLLSGWLTVRAVVTDPARLAEGELRERRIAAACAWLPEGGTLLSTCLGMQYVDGAAPNVREIDVYNYIGYSLIGGRTLDEVGDGVLRLAAAEATRAEVVVWSSEWRQMPELPREFYDVLAAIEARVVVEFRGIPIETGFGKAFRLQPRSTSR